VNTTHVGIAPGPMGPPFTVARLPRIRFGTGVASELAGVVAERGDRLLLVTCEHSFTSERLRQLTDDLASHGVAIVGHVRTSAEPGPDLIDRHVAEARHGAASVVLGIGGGSVLDTAKAVAGLVRSGTSVMDHLEGVGRGVAYTGPAIPFVAAPTTAGTGSEVTRNAVITSHGEQGFKRSFRDDRLIATDAVVDPELMMGAPRSLIAANGLDALTQLIEAYTATDASVLTDALALAGMRAVRDGLLRWHADPGGPDSASACSGMAWAALASGICLASAGLGAVHGLAAPIGARLSIAHGAACGAILAATVRVNISAMMARQPDAPGLARYATVGRVLADLDASATDADARTALVELLEAWTVALGVPRLGQLGLDASDMPRVLAGVSTGSMRSNPVALTDAELRAILLH
jgi:alcohol dehydrogenase class IV